MYVAIGVNFLSCALGYQMITSKSICEKVNVHFKMLFTFFEMFFTFVQKFKEHSTFGTQVKKMSKSEELSFFGQRCRNSLWSKSEEFLSSQVIDIQKLMWWFPQLLGVRMKVI